ncbi:MAG: sigma-54 dependent transcriptional regulator [Planctomycetota bacterium]
MSSKLHLLILDDDRRTRDSLVRLVEDSGFRTTPAATYAEAEAAIAKDRPEGALLDLDLPDGNGMDLARDLRAAGDMEILILTGHGSIDTAVSALRAGVADFLTKPVDPTRLEQALHGMRKTLELRRQVTELRQALRDEGQFMGMVGRSKAMQDVFDHVAKVAPTDVNVLILGETGTGKELAARAVHQLSQRKDGPFIAVNCGALQPSLIESELFGHEAGSFTGAAKRRKGVFEQADGGTLFLDEVFEMPFEQQVNLLRVLETNSIQRVGGERSFEVDVRVVAATNRDPEASIEKGALREDLLYRLMVFPIQLPPLRSRGADLDVLAQHFLDLFGKVAEAPKRFSPEALVMLRSHSWPGNVRELRNVVERAYILGDEVISPECILLDGRTVASADGALDVRVGMSVEEVEKRLILATLEEAGGHKPSAATTLGISLKTLYNRLHAYGVMGDDE